MQIRNLCFHMYVVLTHHYLQDEIYIKVIEPEGLAVGTLYFGHGGDPSHYVALRERSLITGGGGPVNLQIQSPKNFVPSQI